MRFKPFTASAVIVLSAALLAGCTSTTAPSAPSPKARTATAQPSPSATAFKLKGDTAVPSKQYITDAAGKYETVELAPNSIALDPKLWSKVEPAAKKAYTTAQINSAVKSAFTFAVAEGLDSIALDGNEQGWATWRKEVAPKYLYSKSRDEILADVTAPSKHVDRSLLIYNDQNNVFPTLVRDGKPRFSEIAYEPKSAVISAGADGKVKFLSVTAIITAKARATDAEVKKAVLSLNKGDKNSTSAQFDKDYPRYKDGKGINTVTFRYAFAYYLVQENGTWKIGGDQVSPNYDVLGRDLTAAAGN